MGDPKKESPKEPPNDPRQDGDQHKEGPKLSDVVAAVRELADMVQNTQKSTQQVRDELEQKLKELEGSVKAPPKQEPEEDLSKVDLEGMSRTDLVNFITNQMSKKMEKILSGVQGKIENVSQQTRQSKLEQEIERLSEKHKDFYDWTDEMRSIHKKHPTMSVAEAYKLARTEDPDKAKKLDDKYKDPDPDPSSKDGKGGKDSKQTYGGMPPGTAKTSQPTNMTKEQAIENAWNETMAGYSNE